MSILYTATSIYLLFITVSIFTFKKGKYKNVKNYKNLLTTRNNWPIKNKQNSLKFLLFWLQLNPLKHLKTLKTMIPT